MRRNEGLIVTWQPWHITYNVGPRMVCPEADAVGMSRHRSVVLAVMIG